jgi:hypothetical protein
MKNLSKSLRPMNLGRNVLIDLNDFSNDPVQGKIIRDNRRMLCLTDLDGSELLPLSWLPTHLLVKRQDADQIDLAISIPVRCCFRRRIKVVVPVDQLQRRPGADFR